MKIVYIGNVTLGRLLDEFQFDRPLPAVRWGLPLGSEIVLRLCQRGHEVHVLRDHLVDRDEYYHGTAISGSGALHVHFVPCRKRKRWSYLTLFAKEVAGMRRVIREIAPDVVFAQWTYYTSYAGITSGFPTLCVAHDSPWKVFKMQPGPMTIIRALYATFFVAPRMRHLTSVSPYIVDEFRKIWTLPSIDIPVIPNGIRVDGGLVPAFKSYKTAHPTILMVTQWGHLKNAAAMLKAFSQLHPKHPDWRLIAYGNGMDESVAALWMRANGVSDEGIELRGHASRCILDGVIRNEADIFVSPSLEESFGMVFIEAMIQGVPCVGGRNSGAVPWVIGDGGETTDVSNPVVLADCVEKLMLDADRRAAYAKAGPERVRKMFDIEHVVDLYEAELKRVAEC